MTIAAFAAVRGNFMGSAALTFDTFMLFLYLIDVK